MRARAILAGPRPLDGLRLWITELRTTSASAWLAVAAVAAAIALGFVWAAGAFEQKWTMMLIGALCLFWSAVASMRFERFLLGMLFFIIPINPDIHMQAGALPSGSQKLGISVMDLILAGLYVAWFFRVIS